MSTTIKCSLGAKKNNLVNQLREGLADASITSVTQADNFSDFTQALDSITGHESLGFVQDLKRNVGTNNFAAFKNSMNRGELDDQGRRLWQEQGETLAAIEGLEGFSLSNFAGKTEIKKAANLALNAQSHRQTPAAEALYPTVTIGYEEEHLRLRIRAAGIGNYVNGASAYQSASELKPLFGLLRTGEIFKDEVLSLHPVLPSDAGAETNEFFVATADNAPYPANYALGDGFGRTAHNTQMLAVPTTIPNLLALCQTPGQRPWTSTDEIESSSMSVTKLLAKGTLDTDDVGFFIDTSAISNRSFTPVSNGQHSDERGLNMQIRNYPGFRVLDKDGEVVGETLFAAFKTAGVEPMLSLNLTGTYDRQGNELALNGGNVTISELVTIADGVKVTHANATAAQKTLLRSLKAGVAGVTLSMNVSNTSRGNFGYRIEVYDAFKDLATHRRSPVSVKYPVDKNDTNQEALDDAVEKMSIAINNQTSRCAFDEVTRHIDYVQTITGTGVVANSQGSNILPGQHFVSPIAERRNLKLQDAVSSRNNEEVFINVTSAIANEITDMIAAMNHKSGLSSIYEYSDASNQEREWTVVAHSNLARFIMRQGEIRAFGGGVKFNIVETNFDTEFGRILIVPTADSSSDNINPLSGVGVCVSKENVLVQGQVARENQDYNVIMTMPSFKHHSLNVVVGELIIEDANLFLEENMLQLLAKQRIISTP